MCVWLYTKTLAIVGAEHTCKTKQQHITSEKFVTPSEAVVVRSHELDFVGMFLHLMLVEGSRMVYPNICHVSSAMLWE